MAQVKVDRAIYPPGDSIIISGTASKDSYVSIQMTNPDGSIVLLASVMPDGGGAYQRQFKLPPDAVEGVYTVAAGQGGVVKTTTLQISKDAPRVTTSRGHARITIPAIAAGKMATVAIGKTEDMAVRSIEISVKNSVNNIVINITKLAGKPASVTIDVSGKVFHYLSIDKSNFADADIANAAIGFGVEKSWIAVNNIDRSTVALQRYETTGWSNLPTTEIGEDTDSIYYRTVSPGLSFFAITGQTLMVPTSISISVSASSINKGESITASGVISPAVSGVTVKLTYMKAGAVVVERSATTTSGGSFSDVYMPDAGGAWSVAASWAGDEVHLGSTSPTAAFEVVDKGCLIASALIGAVYFAPGVAVLLYGFKRRWSHLPKVSQLRLVLIPWLGSLLFVLLGEFSASPLLMMAATATLVVSTIALTAGTLALKTVNHLSK